MAAELRVIGRHSVSGLECRHLWANGGNNANGFVAGDERELGDEFTFVDVLKSSG